MVTLSSAMTKWKEMETIHEVPDGWESECDNCNWFLENYNREDCILFTSLFDCKFHVLNRYDAKPREDNGR